MTSKTYRWVILGGATIAQICAAFLPQGMGVVAENLRSIFDLSPAQMAYMTVAFGLSPILGLLVAGRALDLFGERLVVGVGTVIFATSLILAGTARTYAVVLMGMFIAGFGYSAFQPGGSRSIARWFDKRRRGLAMGIRQAGLPISGAFAAATFPSLISGNHWRYCFFVGAIAALAGGVVFIVASSLSPNIFTSKTHVASTKTGAIFVEMLGQSWMRRALLYGFSLSGAQFSLVLFLYFDMQNRLSIVSSVAATYLFLMQMSGSLGRIAISWFSDKYPAYRQEHVRICLLASSLGLVTFAIIPQDTAPLLFFITMIWIGFFSIGWYGPWVTAIAENAFPENAGAALGLAMSVNQLGIMAIPLLTGLVIGSRGDGSAAWLSLAFALVSVGVFSKAPCPKIMDRFRRVHGFLGGLRKP